MAASKLSRLLSIGCLLGVIFSGLFGANASALAAETILDPANYRRHVEKFNAIEDEPVINLIPNIASWEWIASHVPMFECPDKQFEETYYYRWWTYRKHIKQTPKGRVITEFIAPVSHAGPYNTVSCALGHHVTEGRWLRDESLLDDVARFWYQSGPNGAPAQHLRRYSNWGPAALYGRYLVTSNYKLLIELLDSLILDYSVWEQERQLPDGLFWQYDVFDGMEESISGGRHVKNARPTINSYMIANSQAIAAIARLASRDDVAEVFQAKSEKLQAKMLAALWDEDAEFFKVRLEDGSLADVREELGYIPWMFQLARPAHAAAWRQINDAKGFKAPFGLTTAERRHPLFRSHGVGTCEWDGAVWPYATSQTLAGLANVLRGPAQPDVTRRDYFRHLLTYARSHQRNGNPFIGEYHDELTGQWFATEGASEPNRHYNHSTFNDLVITGLIGLIPRADDVVEVVPLLPEDAWDWFCLERAPYHGHELTILWDRTGARYQRGPGLIVLADGREIARSTTLTRTTGKLPADRVPAAGENPDEKP